MNFIKENKFLNSLSKINTCRFPKSLFVLCGWFLLLIFLVSCSSYSENKTSKFQNLWKEPAEPPPKSALVPESTTAVPTKKK